LGGLPSTCFLFFVLSAAKMGIFDERTFAIT
jgi:hypothetical protein